MITTPKYARRNYDGFGVTLAIVKDAIVAKFVEMQKEYSQYDGEYTAKYTWYLAVVNPSKNIEFKGGDMPAGMICLARIENRDGNLSLVIAHLNYNASMVYHSVVDVDSVLFLEDI